MIIADFFEGYGIFFEKNNGIWDTGPPLPGPHSVVNQQADSHRIALGVNSYISNRNLTIFIPKVTGMYS